MRLMPPNKEWIEPLLLEERRILFRNFSGEQTKFKPKGEREFHVVITPEEAETLARDGWNVKTLPPRDEDDEPLHTLPVRVFYGRSSPTAVLITHRGKTPLDESMIGILDWAEPKNVDLIIRPNKWDVNGKAGIKAYLKQIYFTMNESALDMKYADLEDAPDSAASALVAQSSRTSPDEDD
jgi:hypothetical protein